MKSENDGNRLAKHMAQLGLCSRREADELIQNGWVKVNGEIITQKGYRVTEADEISLHQLAQKRQAGRMTILLNKPVGYVSAQPEKGYKAALDLIMEKNRWVDDKHPVHFREQHKYGMAPAGRLDIDSVGLLVLTQDGRIAKQLIGEKSTTDKEYLVRVTGKINANGLSLLNHGLSLDGQELLPAKVTWQNQDQLRFILRQGKKRQIRRMCELVGLHVTGLKRIRIGKINLGKLPLGKWRYLRDNEGFE